MENQQSEQVQAKTHWVWTAKAQAQDQQRKAGTDVWPHYLHSAPAHMLRDGMIADASECKPIGQLDLFDTP